MLCLISCSITTSDDITVNLRNSNFNGIKPYSENSRYWEYKGKPLLLLGGSYEDNMFQFPNWYYESEKYNPPMGLTTWTLEEHLDELVSRGGNYIRNTMSSRNRGNRFPFKKISGTPGDNQPTDTYDLDQWDDEYWNRFENFLNKCYDRDIIVQIEIWDRFDFYLTEAESWGPEVRGIDNTGWESNPYNPLRNINYTAAESGLPEVVNYLPGTSPSPHSFFYSVPALQGHQYASEPIVLYYQEKYVEKMLSISLNYPNVLYCSNNETPQPMEWGRHWIQFLRDKGEEAGKTIYASDMRRDHNFNRGGHPEVMSDEYYDFFEASQSNTKNGDEHYDALIYTWKQIKLGDKIKPVNIVKIYETGSEPPKRMWRSIFAGASSARFHRPGYTQYFWGIGLNSIAMTNVKSLRMFTDEMNIFRCEPDNTLLSNRASGEAYCMAEKGKQYAVYFSNGGSVNLDMTGASGEFDLKWLDIANSDWGATSTISGGGMVTLATPGSGQWAVLIKK